MTLEDGHVRLFRLMILDLWIKGIAPQPLRNRYGTDTYRKAQNQKKAMEHRYRSAKEGR